MPTAYHLKLGLGVDQILGASRDRHHMGWIKLVSFWMGNGRATATAAAGGSGSITSSEVSVTKLTDRASMDIYKAASTGREFKSATIEIGDEKSGVPKLRLSLTDVTLENFSGNSATLSMGPTETFKLNFSNAELNHNPIAEESVGDILQTAFKSLGLAPAH